MVKRFLRWLGVSKEVVGGISDTDYAPVSKLRQRNDNGRFVRRRKSSGIALPGRVTRKSLEKKK